MSEDRRRRTPMANQRPSRSSLPSQETPARFRVGRTRDVPRGASMKFMLPIRGIDEECFIINYRGQLYGYVNRCRHVPMAMDWVDNQFFAERGRYLMCQTHNAYYEPNTGECIAGPASTCGKFLYRVPLTIEKGIIYADAPDYDFEGDY